MHLSPLRQYATTTTTPSATTTTAADVTVTTQTVACGVIGKYWSSWSIMAAENFNH